MRIHALGVVPGILKVRRKRLASFDGERTGRASMRELRQLEISNTPRAKSCTNLVSYVHALARCGSR